MLAGVAWLIAVQWRSGDEGGLALSPDERTLLVPLVDAEGSDLMVVEPR